MGDNTSFVRVVAEWQWLLALTGLLAGCGTELGAGGHRNGVVRGGVAADAST